MGIDKFRMQKIYASVEFEGKLKKGFKQTVSKEQFKHDILRLQAERSKDTDHG